MLSLDIRVPRCRSLKDKRAVIKSILAVARRRYLVAAAEVDHQNLHQRALVAMAAVASSVSHVEAVLDEVERFVWSRPDLEVIAAERFWLET